MDTGFLVVVAVGLCLVSAMIVVRMLAQGVAPRRIVVPIGELWLAFVLWMVVLRSVAGAVGAPQGAGPVSEISDLPSRLAAVEGPARAWMVAGLAVSLAAMGHLFWSLQRLMSGSIRS